MAAAPLYRVVDLQGTEVFISAKCSREGDSGLMEALLPDDQREILARQLCTSAL
jgi:hypothetical protein